MTPATVNVRHIGGHSAAERRVGRMAGPTPTGQTIYKTGGSWHQRLTPTSAQVADADPVYVGGHWYLITAAELAEMLADGVTPVYIEAAYPASDLYPSSSTFPGA